MRSKMIMGVILIVLGIVVLAYSGITYKTRGKPVEIGAIHIETTTSHYIPPVVGAVALVGGVLLLVRDTGKA
jgi:membrane-bound ClpP family serine protease